MVQGVSRRVVTVKTHGSTVRSRRLLLSMAGQSAADTTANYTNSFQPGRWNDRTELAFPLYPTQERLMNTPIHTPTVLLYGHTNAHAMATKT